MTLPATPEQIKEVLDRAAQDLFASGAVARFTLQTRQSEWNLANHLAAAIEGYLPELQHDGDLVKPQTADDVQTSSSTSVALIISTT